MIAQLFLLFLIVFISPLFPPIVVPFSYSLLAVLLVQNADPRMLLAISVLGSTLSCVVTRWARIPVTAKIKEFKEKRNHGDLLSRIERKIGMYFDKNNKINTYAEKIENYAKRPHGKVMFALIVVFLLQSSVPDIIAIRFLHKKVSFTFFAVTSFLGKVIVYLPFIFLGMTALTFIRAKLGW